MISREAENTVAIAVTNLIAIETIGLIEACPSMIGSASVIQYGSLLYHITESTLQLGFLLAVYTLVVFQRYICPGKGDLISVFMPTTPNPTSGFLMLVPREECILLDMSVSDAMRLIVSCGAILPGSEEESGEKSGDVE